MVSFISKESLDEMIAKGSYSKSVSMLFLIKDWDSLMNLNSRTWLYRGTEIESITRNWVLLLASSLHVLGTSREDAHMLVVGPGVFHVSFRLKGGLAVDSREITAVVLSPRLLDAIGNARKEYAGETDLVLNEHVAEIPYSLIDKPRAIQEYERGVLAVKVFTAFKDAFKELDERLSDSASYSREHGLKILSSHIEFANRILVGRELGEWAKRKVAKYVDPPDILRSATEARQYMMDIPGVIVSQPGFDELLLTRFMTQGVSAGYRGENSQILSSVEEIKNYVLEKEIPRSRESYSKIRSLLKGGLY